MENIFIDLGETVGVSDDSIFFNGDENLLSESETLVGPAGPPGPQGPKGDPGRDGVDGTAATISVGTTTTGLPGTDAVVVNTGTDSAAVLNFTIPRGEQGEQGIQGEQGEPGDDGEAATIQVGTVTTVAPEYPATVTNSGTSSAAVLNFVIPQGVQGETGPAGQDGQDGAPGQAATVTVGTTTTGAAGTNASVTNSGTSSAAVFNFTIPRGDTGAAGQDGQDGQDGAPGQAATIAVGTTTTGAAGTNASVTNSGTSSAAVFNFTIPRGDTGAAGQDGQDGQDGAAATVTVGTTTTGAAGTNASVTNSGTSSAAVLNFTIPRGDTGTPGITYTTIYTGTGTGDVDLNQSVANFDYIEIYGTELGGRPLYTKLISPSVNTKFAYGITFYAGGVLYTRTRSYTFTSNTKITSTVDSEQIEIRTTGTTMLASGSITITKVVGIKVT